MSPTLIAAVGTEHQRDLRRAASRRGLAALAWCCRPSTWTAASRRVREVLAPRACCA